MRVKVFFVRSWLLGLLAVTLFATCGWAATNWNLKLLHNFGSGTDGQDPMSGLTRDAVGNLYGITMYGGSNCGVDGCGTVFELSPAAGGGWTEKVIYNFGSGTDGSYPFGGVNLDAAGNLYGTTSFGGAYGLGIAFKLSRGAGGDWTETVLDNFGNGSGAAIPAATLVFDAAGTLYGTSESGGIYSCYAGQVGCGTVFELTPNANGTWTETVLHSFGSGTDGRNPYAGVIFDSAGSLYGTTEFGGDNNCAPQNDGCGIAFQLTPNANGTWTETVLHNFAQDGTDGYDVIASLTRDAAGNLYGTTGEGGTTDNGIVFELAPAADGSWTEAVLHNFAGAPDGAVPTSGLTFDSAGNLYGTTGFGGVYGGWGTVFEMSPNAGGGWTENVLYKFCSQNNCADGAFPEGNLILDAAGNLYGVTEGGGTNQCNAYLPQCGTIFKLRAASPCAGCRTSL